MIRRQFPMKRKALLRRSKFEVQQRKYNIYLRNFMTHILKVL